MDPVSQFKFACPVCGQHLEARGDEAGRTTQCPSCFKKLVVPQAPRDGGGKLLITAALADSRRTSGTGGSAGGSRHVRPDFSRVRWIYALWAFVAVLVVVGGLISLRQGFSAFGENGVRDVSNLWTNRVEALQLPDCPVVGKLNGWDFEISDAVWRDTELLLRQGGGRPEGLRLQITFPLRGGELVPGKTFLLGADHPPFDTPIRILWKDEQGRTQSKSVTSGYLLRVQFDEVSSERVQGRLHVCLPDASKSWLAGEFSAINRTRLRKSN